MESNAGTPDLIAYVRRQITNHGPVTFKWFMHQALYHPEHGYYGGGRARIGRRGDFYTSVSIGKIFGELMAKQFEEMWLRMNSPVTFTIIEEGAHNGQFAHDVLAWIQQFSPELFACLKYWIVEPNPLPPAGTTGHFEHAGRATKSAGARTSRCVRGGLALRRPFFQRVARCACRCISLLRSGGPWQENFVDLSTRWVPVRLRASVEQPQLRSHLEKLPPPVRHAGDGDFSYTTEVNLAAPRWVGDWSKILGQGIYPRWRTMATRRDVYYLRQNAPRAHWRLTKTHHSQALILSPPWANAT